MSINDIRLSPLLLQELYPDTLLEWNETGKMINETGERAISCLGNNQKQVAIIVDETDALYLTDEALNFLLGILTACKLSMDDIALLNHNKNTWITYRDISDQLHAKKIILFGISTAALQLPLQFPHYQVQHYNNQLYLSSPALKKIKADRNEKTRLWGSLKQFFEL